MEIVEHHEAFKWVDKELRFRCMKGIVRIEGALYVAEWDGRAKVPESLEQVRIIQELKTEDRGPEMRPSWTTTPPEEHYYVKKPDLHAYHSVRDLEGQIAREIEVCELLKQHPHPNIAAYYGCTELRGRVTGLCFKRYKTTLFEHVNPRYLNKTAFLGSGREHVDDGLEQAMEELLGGIRHLHSLGIIHNDVGPSNIMIDEDGRLVLIDFDSCRRREDTLNGDGFGTKRTHGWHDPDTTEAIEKNDFDAYAELQTWLFGESADSYLFK